MDKFRTRGKLNDRNVGIVCDRAAGSSERDCVGIADHDGHCVPENGEADNHVPQEKIKELKQNILSRVAVYLGECDTGADEKCIQCGENIINSIDLIVEECFKDLWRAEE